MKGSSTLLVMLALTATAQTLAPATATAMDDQGGAGECRSFAGAPPGAGWNGTEFCTLTDGSGGSGGGGGATGGDGSGSGGTVGEVIVILDPYSPPKPTNPLCKNARLCLPGQSGDGRPLGIEGEGPSRGGPKRGGAPAKGEKPKAEVKKPKELTKAEKEDQCREISKKLNGEFYREIVRFWDEIVSKKWDKERPHEVYVKNVRGSYLEVLGFLRKWRGLGCSGLLGEKLPSVYGS